MVNGSAKRYKPSNIRRMEKRKALMEESEAKRRREEEYGQTQVSNPPPLMSLVIKPKPKVIVDKYGSWPEPIVHEAYKIRKYQRAHKITVYDSYQDEIELWANDRDPRCFRKYKPPTMRDPSNTQDTPSSNTSSTTPILTPSKTTTTTTTPTTEETTETDDDVVIPKTPRYIPSYTTSDFNEDNCLDIAAPESNNF